MDNKYFDELLKEITNDKYEETEVESNSIIFDRNISGLMDEICIKLAENTYIDNVKIIENQDDYNISSNNFNMVFELLKSYADQNNALYRDEKGIYFCFRYDIYNIKGFEGYESDICSFELDTKKDSKKVRFTWNEFIKNKNIIKETNEGFEIKCLDCGSTDCQVIEDGDYNSYDEWEFYGYKIICNNCGQEL